MIGQGWKKFCSENGFQEDDEIVFEFVSEKENSLSFIIKAREC